jgi:ABC-type transport system involved in cytochrome c biogenesis permease subunit
MEHENQLVNHRLTWFLSTQAFLFAAFALTFQASTQSKPEQQSFYQFVLAGFSLTGILVGIYIQRPLRTAELAHNSLRNWWHISIEYPHSPEAQRHPPICGESPNWRDNWFPQSIFPLLFVAAWILFIVGILKDRLQPYGSVIGTFTLAGVGVIGVYFLGIMSGRRQSENRSSRRNQV